jgi:AraC-like DNA-binding protein
MDPLSDVLSLLKIHSYACGGFDVGGELCLKFEKHTGIKCYAVVAGESWLVIEGVTDPVQMKAGDCFVLPHGRPFCLATGLGLPPVDFRTLRGDAKNGTVVSYNGGGTFSIVGGHFALSADHASILLGALPPVVHLQKQSDRAVLRWSIERLMEELRDPQPGSGLIAQHLAHTMLLQALRLHLSDGPRGRIGWLFALSDKQMGPAISALHETPGHRWSVQELAERVGMSRSVFAQRFKETVGESPMEYLTRWRMLLARDKLVNSNDPVSVISLALGYESEAAFSTAFRRIMGCSPRQYGRADQLASVAH